jgi:hypothetical protein
MRAAETPNFDQLLEEETPEMLAAVDVGIQSVETEPKLSAEDLRHKLKEWTTR